MHVRAGIQQPQRKPAFGGEVRPAQSRERLFFVIFAFFRGYEFCGNAPKFIRQLIAAAGRTQHFIIGTIGLNRERNRPAFQFRMNPVFSD